MVAAAPVDAEYTELAPPGATIEVRRSPVAGRFLTASTAMPAGEDFLDEAPFAAWPIVGDLMRATAPLHWCESCLLRPIGLNEGSLRHRRYLTKRPLRLEDAATAAPPPDRGPWGSGALCEACSARPRIVVPAVLQHWRAWQAQKSPESLVGLEAFGRCFAQVAANAALLRASCGVGAREAFDFARRPLDRLVAPPFGAPPVDLHGTSSGEVSAALRSTPGFAESLAAAIGGDRFVTELLSEASVQALAGRLVLNTTMVEIVGAGVHAAPLRAAGLYVWLSTMNHACEPTAEVVFGSSGEVTLRTKRAVVAGEALTLAYVPSSMPLAARRARLHHWYFDCDCSRCKAEAHILDAMGMQA
eukprot:NODE_8955_length_1457_cov_7.017293.p1 GENE.NODE_8955_length_1457_cov_7.017293~~NODE_8955_length_1457_cov_7.017293.p1  ORF type:complete len:389 (+),score=108.11 NODE_8955_length_1457_cov_7.017293:93-1169(+)